MSPRLRAIVVLIAVLALVGCGQAELYTGLSERDANDMVAVLRSAGLDAEKSTKDGKSWTLTTSKSEFAQSVSLLEAKGLPRGRFESLGTVFKNDSFISSPAEDHARLVFGLSQELSSTISTIDGVVVARVHIATPDPDPMAETQKLPSASVFIKYDPHVDLSSQVGSIKSLVANSVEGLPYDRVSLVLSPARPFSKRPVHAARAPSSIVWIAAALASGVAALGLWGLRYLLRRRIA